MGISKAKFGNTGDGWEVLAFTMENCKGESVRILTFGAAVQSIRIRDRKGQLQDVVPGFDDVQGYEDSDACFGAVIGRVCNRIRGAAFELNGKTYRLAANEGPNTCHSGPDGYQKRVFSVLDFGWNASSSFVMLGLHSGDGDQGYPGNVDFTVRYTFTDDSRFMIQIEGTPDEDTMINMTNHTYFNLDGEGTGTIADNELCIAADSYLPVDRAFLPLGEYASVSGTPLDFRSMRKIGAGDPDSPFSQLRISGGINHSFRLHAPAGKPAAAAYSPATGIRLNLVTNSPELELYTGDYLQVRNGKNGHAYPPRSGFALEPQYAPDSVHAKDKRRRPIVHKGETFHQEITYAFSVQ
ncbi:MAG: aldose epimerase family protein [Lachnospiraceae bacterium]